MPKRLITNITSVLFDVEVDISVLHQTTESCKSPFTHITGKFLTTVNVFMCGQTAPLLKCLITNATSVPLDVTVDILVCVKCVEIFKRPMTHITFM